MSDTRPLAEFLLRFRWPLLVVAVLVAVVALPTASALRYDRRIESFFAEDDPAIQAFVRMRDGLGGTDGVLLVWPEPDLFDPSTGALDRIADVSERVGDLAGVRGTLSLHELDGALRSVRPGALLGLFGNRDSTPPILDADDPLAAAFRDLFSGYTHAEDGSYAGVVVLLEPTSGDREPLIAELRSVAAALPGGGGYLVGEPALMADTFAMLEADGERLRTTVLVLLSIVLLVLVRQLRWVVAMVAVVLWAQTVTRALLVLLDLRMTLVSSMLGAILTVVAVAALLHLALLLRRRLRRTDDRRHAARQTLARLLPPIFWSAATTAAGFLSLTASGVVPVRQFGLMMALGTATVFVAILLITPALMLLPSLSWLPASGDRRIRRQLGRLLVTTVRHRMALLATTAALTAIAAIGLPRLRAETNFLANFRASSPIVRSYQVVERHLGGAGVWDVLLPAPERFSSAYLDQVRELEDRLREVAVGPEGLGMSKVLSLADADAAAAQDRLLGRAGPTARLAGMRSAIPVFFDALATPPESDGPRWMRVMLRAPEQLRAEDKLALIDRAERIVAEHTASDAWRSALEEDDEAAAAPGDSGLRGTVTGYYVLLARLVQRLLADQWICFAVALVAILLMTWCATRSLPRALAALLPSSLPILAILGLLGWLGRPVNLGTAMIAAVSVGLSIDGSIHYLHIYRHHRRRGANAAAALRRAQHTVGLPVVLATVALAIGFAVLTTSPFQPTVTFGLLVGLTMLGGLLGNILLLPALLSRGER